MQPKALVLALPLLAALGLSAAPELLIIGDAGNAGQAVPFHEIKRPYPRGGVAYPYRIGKTEVTNADYAEFLNACARESDPWNLFDSRMAIVRTGGEGDYRYVAAPGAEAQPVRYVSRVNAARYCNYLTTGDATKGAYVVEPRVREDGRVNDAIVGHRDLTFPEQARVFHLPDMHEFHKAGWYDRAGGWRSVTVDTRHEPSAYGVLGHASGVREWVEEKYYGANTFALGADDSRTDAASLNGVQLFMLREFEGNEHTGFRVAATAPLQIGDRLNTANNFFFDADTPARLRIRHDGPAREVAFSLELRDFTNSPVWSKKIRPRLRPGVTELPVDLPTADGFYQLVVTPDDPLFNGQSKTIPLAVMREPMPALGARGNFGMTVHIVRRERRFSFEDVDFSLFHKLGLSHIRVDVSHSDINGSQTVLRRIHEAGLNPLAIISRGGLHSRAELARNLADNPDLVSKWSAHGIPAEFAWYAEQVFRLVSAHKDVVRDWEFGNEPTYWDLLAEDYAQALKAGYKAAKLADPTANVMAGDLNAIHAPVFQTGAAPFADSIATHIYGFYVPTFWGIPGKMRELKGWMNAAGIPEKPIWITEIGGCTYNHMHMIPVRSIDEVHRYQALHQPKTMAGGMAFGASKVLPYNFRETPRESLEEEFGMIDRFGLPKPAIASFRTTARMIGDARFVGFVNGHSFEIGQNAGLAFKDAKDRDVVVFWRNDQYGYNHFDTPFFDIIKPPVNVAIPASGDSVEIVNLTGGTTKVPVKNGRVIVPVNEYPVFVRGRLSPKLVDVSTAHDIAPLKLAAARVKILPDYSSRAADLMSGVVLDLPEGREAPVRVRVYNTRSTPLAGSLRLVPKNNWREWAWDVAPREIRVELPADGMTTAEFSVPTPAKAKPDQLFYLDAIFTPDAPEGAEFRDTVALRVAPEKLKLAEWTTYAKGYKLASEANGTQARITWEKDRANAVSFFRRSPAPFAEDEAGLDRDVSLSFRPEHGAGVRALSLLFFDRNNETFQIKKTIRPSEGAWTSLRFSPRAILEEGVIVHRGGDQKVDFPVRLLGFTFDLNPADGGSILMKPYEIHNQTVTPKTQNRNDIGGGAPAEAP